MLIRHPRSYTAAELTYYITHNNVSTSTSATGNYTYLDMTTKLPNSVTIKKFFVPWWYKTKYTKWSIWQEDSSTLYTCRYLQKYDMVVDPATFTAQDTWIDAPVEYTVQSTGDFYLGRLDPSPGSVRYFTTALAKSAYINPVVGTQYTFSADNRVFMQGCAYL